MLALLSLSTTGAPVAPTTAPPLWGLALVANGPAKVGLVQLDASTGKHTNLGSAHSELFGVSDLTAVANGVFYYLGDTAGGATLVGLNATDGTEVCNAHVDVSEIKFVGLGQSLDHDASSGSLVLSGVASNGNASHAVYKAPDLGCGPFKHAGSFGEAEYIPMLHASALDAEGQRLFVTIATGKNTDAIGVVDLKAGGKMRVIAEDATPDYHDSLLCMHWDAKIRKLLGAVALPGSTSLQLHALDPTSGAWDAAKVIKNVPTKWNALGGNGATASAFSATDRALYFMAGIEDPDTGAAQFDLATIDVDAASVVSHPPLGEMGMAGCGDCLLALTN
jgi:hypothetical protein